MSQTAVFVNINGRFCDVLPYAPSYQGCVTVCRNYANSKDLKDTMLVEYVEYEIGDSENGPELLIYEEDLYQIYQNGGFEDMIDLLGYDKKSY